MYYRIDMNSYSSCLSLPRAKVTGVSYQTLFSGAGDQIQGYAPPLLFHSGLGAVKGEGGVI